jgi:hypothetical protein
VVTAVFCEVMVPFRRKIKPSSGMSNVCSTQIWHRKAAIWSHCVVLKHDKCKALYRTSRLKTANLMTLFTCSYLSLSQTARLCLAPFSHVFVAKCSLTLQYCSTAFILFRTHRRVWNAILYEVNSFSVPKRRWLRNLV